MPYVTVKLTEKEALALELLLSIGQDDETYLQDFFEREESELKPAQAKGGINKLKVAIAKAGI